MLGGVFVGVYEVYVFYCRRMLRNSEGCNAGLLDVSSLHCGCAGNSVRESVRFEMASLDYHSPSLSALNLTVTFPRLPAGGAALV